jgi:hypothetical protein
MARANKRKNKMRSVPKQNITDSGEGYLSTTHIADSDTNISAQIEQKRNRPKKFEYSEDSFDPTNKDDYREAYQESNIMLGYNK